MRFLDSLRSLEMTEGGFPIWPGSPPAEHPDEKYYIFGKEGDVRMAEKYGIQLLGRKSSRNPILTQHLISPALVGDFM